MLSTLRLLFRRHSQQIPDPIAEPAARCALLADALIRSSRSITEGPGSPEAPRRGDDPIRREPSPAS